MTGLVLPSVDDPVVGGLVQAVGGPPGRRARLGERRVLSPVRWLVVLTLLTSVLGLWQKSPCRVHPWAHEYQYTRACYTDVFALYYSERLQDGAVPYVDQPVEYPVLIGAAMAAVDLVTPAVAALVPGDRLQQAREQETGASTAAEREQARTAVDAAVDADRARTFFDLTWVLLTVCAVVVVLTTARLAGRRVWDAALVALSPGLPLHATTNWDLLAVALAGLGLLAWARSRPVLAGVLLGLGTATKLYPVLFLLPLAALCWRTGQLRAWARAAGGLLAAAALVTVPVYLASPAFAQVGGAQVQVAGSPLDRLGGEGLGALAPHATGSAGGQVLTGVNGVYRFVELNATRPADWDSLYFALQTTRGQVGGPLGRAYDAVAGLALGPAGSTARLDLSVALATLVAEALVVLLVLRAPRRPRLPQVLFLAVVGFLLANKVFSPQYVLWLLPLAALARPRWGPFLAWGASEAFLLFTRFYYFVSLPAGEGDQQYEGLRVSWFLSAVVVRDLVLLALCAAVVRDVLRPEGDRVRAGGVDDPAGGVLDGAPDRVREPAAALPG